MLLLSLFFVLNKLFKKNNENDLQSKKATNIISEEDPNSKKLNCLLIGLLSHFRHQKFFFSVSRFTSFQVKSLKDKGEKIGILYELYLRAEEIRAYSSNVCPIQTKNIITDYGRPLSFSFHCLYTSVFFFFLLSALLSLLIT